MSELIFDQYEVLHRLAIGGMGEVFYAVQRGAVRGFERPVILKSLLPDLAQQPGFVEQFLDEARVAATLNHPNVVSIYEVGLWDGTYYIAMEFIHGRNLSQLIKTSIEKKLPIPPAVIARIIHDAALGLDHAHGATDSSGNPLNIVHRDISPQNIMVRGDGVTKVVDFGIARAANRNTRTATGALKGKLAYMAPEQITTSDITGLADQYSLGVVLWEMSTRQRLFRAEDDVNLIKKVMTAEIPRPSSLVPGLPEELDEICLRMVQREPQARFPDAAEVARAIETFLAKFSPPSSESPVATYMKALGIDTAPPLPPRAPSTEKNYVISLSDAKTELADPSALGVTIAERPSAQSTNRKLWAAATVAVLMVVAAAAALYVVSSEGEPEPPGPIAVAPSPAPTPVPEPVGSPKESPTEVPLPLPGHLLIKSVPPGATVRLDGRKAGETPLKLELAASIAAHLQLDRPGYLSLEEDVTLNEGEERTVELKLHKRREVEAPAPVAPPPMVAGSEPGFLSIDTDPWTRVSVDGDPFGSTPIFKKKLTAGSHVVVMETEAGLKATRKVEIRPGDVTKLQLDVR